METVEANAKDGPTTISRNAMPILFNCQGMYAHPARGGGTVPSRSQSTTAGGRFDPLTIAGCFNCEDPAHTMHSCPRPINAVKAAQCKLSYYNKKHAGGRAAAMSVLYELCVQLDISSPDDKDAADTPVSHDMPSDDDDGHDASLFETLLLTDGSGAPTAQGGNGGPDVINLFGTRSGLAADFGWEE